MGTNDTDDRCFDDSQRLDDSQRFLNVSSTFPQRFLNVSSTFPQRFLNFNGTPIMRY